MKNLLQNTHDVSLLDHGRDDAVSAMSASSSLEVTAIHNRYGSS